MRVENNQLLSGLLYLYRKYKQSKSTFLGLFFPKYQAKRVYRSVLHRKLDLKNPVDLNEKINWLKFYGKTDDWVNLADKYLVREYVLSKGLDKILPLNYGHWYSAREIDFDSLPSRFVLKTNHGCGSVIIVKDKSLINKEEICSKLDNWLKERYGARTAEPHYLRIKPCIIAEELLENTCDQSDSIVDYKVWCLDGKPYCIHVCANRIIGVKAEMSFYSLDWELMEDVIDGPHKNDRVIIPKPKGLNEMLNSASILSSGHPEVRVDFYDVDGRVYFGEMTFTSLGGYMNYISPKYLRIMGEKVTIK